MTTIPWTPIGEEKRTVERDWCFYGGGPFPPLPYVAVGARTQTRRSNVSVVGPGPEVRRLLARVREDFVSNPFTCVAVFVLRPD